MSLICILFYSFLNCFHMHYPIRFCSQCWEGGNYSSIPLLTKYLWRARGAEVTKRAWFLPWWSLHSRRTRWSHVHPTASNWGAEKIEVSNHPQRKCPAGHQHPQRLGELFLSPWLFLWAHRALYWAHRLCFRSPFSSWVVGIQNTVSHSNYIINGYYVTRPSNKSPVNPFNP